MPNKMRLLLMTPHREVIHGSQVVAMLCKMTQRNLKSLVLPNNWLTLTTKARLEFLASQMPKGYEFSIIREPRHTRRNRSQYFKTIIARQGGEFFSARRPTPDALTSRNGNTQPVPGPFRGTVARTRRDGIEVRDEEFPRWANATDVVRPETQTLDNIVTQARRPETRLVPNADPLVTHWNIDEHTAARTATVVNAEIPTVNDQVQRGVPANARVLLRQLGGLATRYERNGRIRHWNLAHETWVLEARTR